MTLLFFGGLINGIVSIIWLRGEIFREIREMVIRVTGGWAKKDGRLSQLAGRKLSYLADCLLCSGTWIGLVEGIFFAGPFHGWWAFIAAGLAYKAVGHIYVQASDWIGNRIDAA